jgi:two-component system chemotaxis response regulator CheY
MSQRVVLVGHCGPDSSYLRISVANALPGAKVVAVDDAAELEKTINAGADLLLVNRQLDFGFEETEGVELIRNVRSRYPELKTILVSNYPEAQSAAMAAGAVGAFGKRDLGSSRVTQLLRDVLETDTRDSSTTK